jgi:DNA ligase (NAD+)
MTSVNLKPLSPDDAKAEHDRLSAEIRTHAEAYYGRDAPLISDAEYDTLFQQLIAIEEIFPELATSDSPSTKVGTPPSVGFTKVEHNTPMLSLANALNNDDVSDFAARVRRFLGLDDADPMEFVAEPKIDGLSASIRYENGTYMQAATRGD